MTTEKTEMINNLDDRANAAWDDADALCVDLREIVDTARGDADPRVAALVAAVEAVAVVAKLAASAAASAVGLAENTYADDDMHQLLEAVLRAEAVLVVAAGAADLNEVHRAREAAARIAGSQ